MATVLSKEFTAAREYMKGARCFTAIRAMEFASTIHTGTRKDGTPEFGHQMGIAHYLRTLGMVNAMTDYALAAAFFHDLVEDYPQVQRSRLVAATNDAVVTMAECLSKNGLTESEYMGRLIDFHMGVGELDHLPALIKGADRIHNLSTANGGFSAAKIVEYVAESRATILPMLKTVQRRFPEYDNAFENERLTIKMLCRALAGPEKE